VSSSNPSVLMSSRPDADDARAVWPMLAQIIKNRRPALWVMRGRDEAARLMEQKKPRPGAVDEGLAVDGDLSSGRTLTAGFVSATPSSRVLRRSSFPPRGGSRAPPVP